MIYKPLGSKRYVALVEGDETEEEIARLSNSEASFAMLKIKPELSRVHASRRVFELLAKYENKIAVIHYVKYPESHTKDEVVI